MRIGIRKILCLELHVDALQADGPLKGCGLIVINPPFVLEEEARALLPELTRLLAQGPGASHRIFQLAGE